MPFELSALCAVTHQWGSAGVQGTLPASTLLDRADFACPSTPDLTQALGVCRADAEQAGLPSPYGINALVPVCPALDQLSYFLWVIFHIIPFQ